MLKKIKDFVYIKILRRKYYRRGTCLCCGKCCKKIYVKHIKGVIQSEEEFEELINLHRFYTYLRVIDQDETGLVFSCSNLDEATNLCNIHDKRPGICRRYPQEEIFSFGGKISEDCGYQLIPIIPFSQILKKKMRKTKQ